MTIKEWLNRGYKIDLIIKSIEREKRRALQRATYSGTGTGERVKTSSVNSSEERMSIYASYGERLDKEIQKLCAVKLEIFNFISSLENNTHRQLLMLRYIEYQSWEEIAEEMNYSEKWVRTGLHTAALNEAEKSRGV